jgi:putative glutamine amidotransferase
MTVPWVGVTGPARGGRSGWAFTWLALRTARARARRLRPPYRPEQLDGLSGMVIGGGANVDPARYAQQPAIEYVYDEQRDEFEWRVLREVMKRGLPLLGICRGAQLINVFAGGNLWQNLTEDMPGLNLRRHVLARKLVSIEPDTMLSQGVGVRQLKVNSLHRQGIRDVGRGLRVSARDADGIVQAIEAAARDAQFIVGVQWHPEYLVNHFAHRRLFAMLVHAAALRSRPAAHALRP